MKLIYGIIYADEDPVFDTNLYGVSAAGFTAVVADAPDINYQLLSQENLLKQLKAHQQVVEAFVQTRPFLPFQFGSHLHNDAQVGYMLQQCQARFERLWSEFEGLIQVRIRVLWQPAAVSEQIAEELNIPSIQRESAQQVGAEAENTRTEIARMMHVRLAEQQANLEELVMDHVRPLAKSIVRNPQLNEETAVDLSALMKRPQVAKLQEIARLIEAEVGHAYRVRCAGPFPPYSFAKVSVRAPKPGLIAHARELLGLGERVTQAEMKAAFQAHPYHIRPDKDSDLDSILKMTELAQAYKLLKELAASQDGGVCRLDPTFVAQTILLTIQRPEQKKQA